MSSSLLSTTSPNIGIFSRYGIDCTPYRDAITRFGANVLSVGPDDALPAQVTGLMLCGSWTEEPLERVELDLLKGIITKAVECGFPVLGIESGLHFVNIVFGGCVGDPLSAHGDDPSFDDSESEHKVFISPGSKLAHILGGSGHVGMMGNHRISLEERHKAPSVLASAYCIDDGSIEAIEMPGRSWVLGVGWPVHQRDRLSSRFENLLLGFLERATEIPPRRLA